MKKVLVCGFFLLALISANAQVRDTLPNLPEHYKTRLAKFKLEPVVTGKIMFVGNSITEGGNWRKLLKDSTVINRGISGDNTFGLLQRIEDITKRQPKSLFLLIGVNDLSKNIPNEMVIENIFAIITRIHSQSPRTRLFIQSILPVNPSVKNFPSQFSKQKDILEINAQIKKYAEPLKFVFVDIHSHFSDDKKVLDARYTYDGLHLNDAGYAHWLEYLRKNKYL